MTTTSQSNITSQNLYEKDFYLWIQETAKFLKEERFEEIDLANLIEEIEAMGRSDKRELKSRLTTVIEHLLKSNYWLEEKERNLRGWKGTIIEQRRQIQGILEDSPSLNNFIEEIFLDCYQIARKDSLKKYQLPPEIFPAESPFTIEQVLDPDYLPE